MKFQCSKCGACCRRAGMLGLMPQRADGACINLAEDNTCKIYETRPEICRVDKMCERMKGALNMTTKEYFKYNSEFCNAFIREDGLDKSFLIDLNKYDEIDGTDAT